MNTLIYIHIYNIDKYGPFDDLSEAFSPFNIQTVTHDLPLKFLATLSVSLLVARNSLKLLLGLLFSVKLILWVISSIFMALTTILVLMTSKSYLQISSLKSRFLYLTAHIINISS